MLCALALYSYAFPGTLPKARALSATVAGAALTLQCPDGLPWYLDGSEFVFITATGDCYHIKDDCRNTKTSYLVSLEEAIRLGYRDCGLCHPTDEALAGEVPTLPEGEPIVYVLHDDTTYHNADHHDRSKTRRPVTLDEAAYLGKNPCPICFPDS